jgi:hypothetical protein
MTRLGAFLVFAVLVSGGVALTQVAVPTPSPAATPTPVPEESDGAKVGRTCVKPKAVQRIAFSVSKYRHVRAHRLAALKHGWPRILVLNRLHARDRSDRLLKDHAARGGYDLDEYPPAVGRGRGKGLTRGSKPRGWKADAEYVTTSESVSHRSLLGAELKPFCDGVRFRYVFTGTHSAR